MDNLPFMGTVFVVIGITMIVLRRTIGIGFCKLGKLMWRNNPFQIPSEWTDEIYDERTAPRNMLILGTSLAVGGVIFWFLPKLM